MDRSSSATRAYGLMMEKFSRRAFVCLFLLFVVQVNGYSKFGRSCKDIGCLSTQRCVMVDQCDPDGNKCGYPTCVNDKTIKQTCDTKFCGGGQHCVSENGVPKCINDKPISVRRPDGEKRRPLPSRFHGRYNSHLTSDDRGSRNGSYPKSNDIRERSRYTPRIQPSAPRTAGSNSYKTHESTDSNGNRQWTFSR